jgi:hypothetical protein
MHWLHRWLYIQLRYDHDHYGPCNFNITVFPLTSSGADPGFQVRGAHLKKLRRAVGGAKFFGVFRVKNHDFTTNNHIFFHLRREARKFLGYFVWKITILRQKIIFFPILGGGGRTRRAPPWIRPWSSTFIMCIKSLYKQDINKCIYH